MVAVIKVRKINPLGEKSKSVWSTVLRQKRRSA